jgi:hypothetical protein
MISATIGASPGKSPQDFVQNLLFHMQQFPLALLQLAFHFSIGRLFIGER